jgi:hypothetical protein
LCVAVDHGQDPERASVEDLVSHEVRGPSSASRWMIRFPQGRQPGNCRGTSLGRRSLAAPAGSARPACGGAPWGGSRDPPRGRSDTSVCGSSPSPPEARGRFEERSPAFPDMIRFC